VKVLVIAGVTLLLLLLLLLLLVLLLLRHDSGLVLNGFEGKRAPVIFSGL
jgi:hypothetical protein